MKPPTSGDWQPRPTVTGWYWMRSNYVENPVAIFFSQDKPNEMRFEGRWRHIDSFGGIQFSAPLTPPATP